MSYITKFQPIYSVNFTTLSTQNLLTGGDGTKTIDGYNWTATNTTNASTMGITNGTGLVITNSAASTSGNNTTLTGPMLSIPFNNIFAYNLERHIVRVMIRISASTIVTNTEGVRLGVINSSTPTSTAGFSVFKGFVSGVNQYLPQSNQNTGSGTTLTSGTAVTTNLTDDVLSFIWEGPRNWEVRSGVFANSTLPFLATNFIWSESLNYGNSELRTATNPLIYFGIQSGNTNATASATFSHLRIDIAKKY